METYEFTGDKKKFKDLLEKLPKDVFSKTVEKTIFDLFLKYASRAYHNIDHVLACLTELEQLEKAVEYFELPIDFTTIKLALWYHDVEDTEKASLTYFYGDFPIKNYRGLPNETHTQTFHEIMDLTNLIMATKPGVTPKNIWEGYIKDIDLSILGKPLDVFKEYENKVRQEYPQYEDEVFCKGRAEILKGFMMKEFIYYTRYFRDRYERQARINLRASIEKLESRKAIW